MKRKYINKGVFLFAAILILGSCTESYIDGYDISPNAPIKVTEPALLSATEVAIFGSVTGEYARTTSIFVQTQAGYDLSSLAPAQYNIAEGDNVNDWQSLYSDWMETSSDLIAISSTNPYYNGIGLILKGWSGAFASDLYGDVPFKEAVQGKQNLNPKYDTQEEVYRQAQNLFSQGITQLSKQSDLNTALPGEDDFIYKGDIDRWIKLANTLKARYYNRISKKLATSADSVLKYSALGFTKSDENCNAIFSKNAANANQWYAFYIQRSGYMYMGGEFVEKLKTMNDPRLAYYCSKNSDDQYFGSPSDTHARDPKSNPSEIGNLFYKSDAPVPMASFEEICFLRAEAFLRTGDKINAAISYNEGVLSSVKLVTGSDAPATFTTNYASKVSGDMNIELVMNGKYDALFTQVEVWSDWRRTNFPTLVPNPDPLADSKGIPYRFPTSIDERLYNTNAVAIQDTYAKPWFATN